ncbi:MAG TPA: hypothetical protein VD931_01900 [Baekduia sp.]|nr:hypothetical protein [Baekduia sp.]
MPLRPVLLHAAAALVTAAPAAASTGLTPSQALHRDPAAVDRFREEPTPRGGPAGRPLSAVTADGVRAALPTAHCGERRSADDTVHEVDNGPYRYHAIYAVPAGETDRFPQVATALQTDALQASALLERRYGRAIRFDMGTSCGPQFLDISTVRLGSTAAQLTASGDSGAILHLVSEGLRAAGFDPLPMQITRQEAASRRKNFVVWLEGVRLPGVCGVGSMFDDVRRAPDNLNDLGGKLAVVFRSSSTAFCSSSTVRHEIGHNLGALQRGAPNEHEGHCTDAVEDTMCTAAAAPPRGDGRPQQQFFDFGNDDYWDPPAGPALPRWTLNLSRFLCPDVSCNVPGGTPLDELGTDLLGSCPELELLGPRGCDASGSTAARQPGPPPEVVVTMRRAGRRHFRIGLRLRGGTPAQVDVRCRRGRRTVRAARVRLRPGQRVKRTVRCTGRPRAVARRL